MHVVLVEVALEVVREEAMAVAVAVGTISVSLAFDDALGGGGLFDHGLAAVGRRVVQGEMQWKPYYTTSAVHDSLASRVCGVQTNPKGCPKFNSPVR